MSPVSHTDTVNHLKLLVYQYTDLTPSQQQLSQDEVRFRDSSKTLGEYGAVASKCFDVQEVLPMDNDDAITVIEDARPTRPERGGGFANSKLVSGSGRSKHIEIDKKKKSGKSNNHDNNGDKESISLEFDLSEENGEEEEEQWACSHCTLLNMASATICLACESIRSPNKNKRGREEDSHNEEENERPPKKPKRDDPPEIDFFSEQ